MTCNSVAMMSCGTTGHPLHFEGEICFECSRLGELYLATAMRSAAGHRVGSIPLLDDAPGGEEIGDRHDE